MPSVTPASPRLPRSGLHAAGSEGVVAPLDERERLLRVLSVATFLIFFQAYMVAPLIPKLSAAFQVSPQSIGLIVPAYMIPYGVSTLFYGLLSDRIGRRRIVLASLLVFIVLTAATATALGGRRGGQDMGLNVFLLFTGFGLGSLIFGEVLRFGFPTALGLFAGVQAVAAVTAVPLFRSEGHRDGATPQTAIAAR